MCEIDIGNPKYTQNTLRLSSGTKLFITFELKGFFDMREKHNISMLIAFTLSALNPTNAWQP